MDTEGEIALYAFPKGPAIKVLRPGARPLTSGWETLRYGQIIEKNFGDHEKPPEKLFPEEIIQTLSSDRNGAITNRLKYPRRLDNTFDIAQTARWTLQHVERIA